jgi:hypothetical protein
VEQTRKASDPLRSELAPAVQQSRLLAEFSGVHYKKKGRCRRRHRINFSIL